MKATGVPPLLPLAPSAKNVDPDAVVAESSVRRRIWLAARGTSWFIGGAALFATLLSLAFLYPWWSGADPLRMNLQDRLLPPAFVEGGRARFLLGTDSLGRDMFSRSLVGLQISFLIGLSAVLSSFVIGSAVGLWAGFRGGRTDPLLMRLVDTQLSIPPVILAITVLGLLRPSPALVVMVLALAGWPLYARVTRAAALAERGAAYVSAARVLGATDCRIVLLMIAPAVLPSSAFAAILDLARVMILEATLDFLGLGLQPPTPTLGVIIADGRKYLINAWWVASLPGVFLMLMLLAANMMGVALERARNKVLGGL